MPKTRRVISSFLPEHLETRRKVREVLAMVRAELPRSIAALRAVANDETANVADRADAAKFLASYGLATKEPH